MAASTQLSVRNKLKVQKGHTASELDTQVAQALFELETGSAELKVDLRGLAIVTAREVDVGADGKKCIVVFVPFTKLKAFQRVHVRLVRELEKKFSGRHVAIIAQRRILPVPAAAGKTIGRARSRSLTSVHEKILDDLVYPAEIVGKRTKIGLDGRRVRVILDKKEQTATEYKIDSFSAVYKKLTGKNVTFDFEA